MKEKQSSDYVLIALKNLNLIIIIYIAGIMAFSLYGCIYAGNAEEFLLNARRVPYAPWKQILVPLFLYVACLLVMYIPAEKNSILFMEICVEIVLGLILSGFLGFSYIGIVLLVLADTMKYFPKSTMKFPVAIVICLFYLLVNYDFMSIYFEVIPFSVYLDYFQSNVQSLLLGIENVLSSLNTFGFLVYMVVLLQTELDEKERIMNLNRQLNDANRQLNEANSELQQANIQLEEYAREEEQMVATRERNRLAREIHDTLGHALTGIITGLEACTALMDVAPEAAKAQIGVITDVARQGITDVRRSVKALRPDALEKYDLADAIMMTVEEMKKAAGVEIFYQCGTSLNCFNNDEEEVIYRIVQESITNAIRHGHAGKIWIDIEREYGVMKIRIRDNGVGCTEIKKGFGLHHMEERLSLLQGKLFFSGEDGFTIEAHIPIRWGETEEKND